MSIFTRHRSRRLFGLLALAAVSCLAVACGDDDSGAEASAGDGTTDSFTLRVGYISTGATVWGGPEGYAHSRGALLEALAPFGVTKIETFGFANGPEVSQAILGGSIDVATYGDTPVLNATAAGAPTRAINQNRINLEAILFTPAGGITSVEELEGGRIGVAQGSFMHRFVLGLLEAEGLTDKVEVTNIPVIEYASALTANDVTAVAVPWSTAPLFEEQGFARLLSTFPDYPDIAGSSLTIGVEEFLEAHPGFVAAWNDARREIIEEILADPDPYYDFQQEVLRVDRDLVPELENVAESNPVEPFTDEGRVLLDGTKQFLLDIGAAQSDFDLDAWIYPADS